MKTYVVSVSGGAGSTLALHRTVEKHGVDNTLAIFADTNTEDATLYDLLRAIKKMFPSLRFIWLKNDDMDIWDIFDKHGIIRTPKGACKGSIELKHRSIARWVTEHYTFEDAVIVTGMDYAEPERRKRIDERWLPFECWHPLSEAPILSACEIISECENLGYPEQDLYQKGYQHNNCGGACVLAGLGQWHGLYLDNPKRFSYHEKRESDFNKLHRKGKTQFTVLRDQSAKSVIKEDGQETKERKVTPLTLQEFRLRIERNDPTLNLRDFRSVCGCMHHEQIDLFNL